MTDKFDSAMPGINALSLGTWFEHNIPNCRPPLAFTLIAGGQSNLTFRVVDAVGRAFVLRRPPLGTLPPRAHDVAREYRIQTALKGTSVPVPSVLGVCTDRSVNDADFYVMSWVQGFIVDTIAKADDFLPTSVEKRVASNHLIDAFAALHRLNYEHVGLADLSQHTDYVGRSLKRMHQVWERTKTREYPLIDSIYFRLLECKPPQTHTAIIHSDYRFGNVMFAADSSVIAILDWELCTIGDPLADLGFFVNNWDLPNDPWPDVWTQIAPTCAGGFPNRDEMIDRYASATGFDVESLNYYRAFNYWRIAVIAEGIKRRYLSGAMAQQQYDSMILEKRVKDRAELADYFLNL